MTDHSPDHAERAREAARDIRNAMLRSMKSGHKQAHMNYGPLTVCLDQIDTALGRDAVREAAWRDGFNTARQCLTEDEAFTLTEDVEHDAWLDSTTRAALTDTVRGEGENG